MRASECSCRDHAAGPEGNQPGLHDYPRRPDQCLDLGTRDRRKGIGPNLASARFRRDPPPHLSETDANGLTEHELEQLVHKKYDVEGIIRNATVSVSVVEARGQTFSILGQVNKPGQYPVHDPDFRLLNAIAQAEGSKEGVTTARIIRKPKPVEGEDKPRGRTLEIPLKPLLDGNLDLNVVIRPGDTIVVAAPRPQLVRVVVGPEAIAFEGQRTTWEELPKLLEKIPQAQRGGTMLELAVESNDITVGRFFDAQARASQLVKELGLSAVSFVGVHPLDSKGGQAPVGVGADEHVFINGDVEHSGVFTLGARMLTVKQLVTSAQIKDAVKEPRRHRYPSLGRRQERAAPHPRRAVPVHPRGKQRILSFSLMTSSS